METDLPDYRNDAQAYEIEELARPDEVLMFEGIRRRSIRILDNTENAYVLDLCCGTGLSLQGVLEHRSVASIVGVDNCKEYLDLAGKKFSDMGKVRLLLADAVDVDLGGCLFDLIILSSAYHHIEDARKIKFLKKVRALLRDNGRIVVAENILPPYDYGDHNAYSAAVKHFYTSVLETATDANPHLPTHVHGLIERVAKYGFDGEYEFKTGMDIFLFSIKAAGLQVVGVDKVWPTQGPLSLTNGGNYVFELSRQT